MELNFQTDLCKSRCIKKKLLAQNMPLNYNAFKVEN